MKLKPGDRVSVLDDVISGIVIAVHGANITVETDEGFALDFDAKDLVKESKQADLFQHIASADIHAAKSEKTTAKKKITLIKQKPKEIPAMEVDLHIHQLTTNFKRMSNYDMLTLQLDTARRQLEFAIQKRIQRVIFIHGVGEGVLKTELEYLFGRYDNIKFYDANYQKYGVGATEVYIFQNTK